MTACPACGSLDDCQTVVAAPEPVLKCARCGSTFFARPINSPYDYETYYPYLGGFDRARFQWEIRQRRARFLFQLREIERLGPPGRVLVDFGAGPGYFCAVAREAGWDALGIETSTQAIEAGVGQFGVRYTRLEQVAAGSCSVMTAFHVIEHLDAPGAVLREFHEKLAHRGLLVVHVPNRESLSAWIGYALRRIGGRPGRRYGCLYYPEHITGFTPAGLAMCADKAGFDLVRLRHRSLGSRFYDPWFVRNCLLDNDGKPRQRGLRTLLRKALAGLIDNIGSAFGRGDWLVAHFRAR